jgi:hypothetical protein
MYMAARFFKPFIALLCWGISMGTSCDSSHEGTATSVTGVYSCQESSAHGGTRKYLVEIDSVRDREAQFIISNFHNLGTNEFLYSELEGDTLRIFNQVMGDLRISGKGSVSPDFRTISFYYETDDALNIYGYYAVYSR